MILIKELSETDFTLNDIHEFIKTVYEKRADDGIHFQALSKPTESIEQRINDNHGIVFVAVDEQSQELLGTGTILFHNDDNQIPYAGFILAAVRPDAQGRGIGHLLRQRREKCAKEMGCHYIISSTASNAESSIKYHLKNGAKKYGFSSSKNSDYYSIIFRKDIVSSYKGSTLYCFIRYHLTKTKTKLLFHEDGTYTKLGGFCRSIIKTTKISDFEVNRCNEKNANNTR